jgi:hypothetical protein
MAVTAFRAPGSATVRSAPRSVGWVAPPDNELVIVSRALWSAGTRAHVPAALRLRGAQLFLEGARSVHNVVMYPCARGSWLPASPRPGMDGPAAHERAVMRRAASTRSVARRTPARRRARPGRPSATATAGATRAARVRTRTRRDGRAHCQAGQPGGPGGRGEATSDRRRPAGQGDVMPLRPEPRIKIRRAPPSSRRAGARLACRSWPRCGARDRSSERQGAPPQCAACPRAKARDLR